MFCYTEFILAFQFPIKTEYSESPERFLPSMRSLVVPEYMTGLEGLRTVRALPRPKSIGINISISCDTSPLV